MVGRYRSTAAARAARASTGTGPTRATSISISYAMRPTSASSVPSTAMQAPLPPARHEQEPGLHLDDGLPDPAAGEPPAGPAGEPVHPGRDGRQVLRVLPAQAGGAGDQQAVGGEDHRVLHVGHPIDQIVDQPCDVERRARPLCHGVTFLLRCRGSPASE